MTDDTPGSKLRRVKPGAILRAAGYGGPAEMPNFNVEPASGDAIATEATRAAPGDQPRLAVEREGDQVARIIAYCRCGEKIVIDCDYPGVDAT